MEGNWNQSAAVEQRYRYNGMEFSEELGLYDYGARWYDPAIGRWTSVDPLADSYAPISPFAYVANNPISLIDPDGMSISVSLNGNSTFTEQAAQSLFKALQDKYGDENTPGGDQTSSSTGGVGSCPPGIDCEYYDKQIQYYKDKFKTKIDDVVSWFTNGNLLPDGINFGLDGSMITGASATASLDLEWITNGPNAGLLPYVTSSGGLGAGFDVGGGLHLGLSWSLYRDTPIFEGDLETRYNPEGHLTYGGNANLAAGSFGGSYTPSSNIMNANIGLGPSFPGGSVSGTTTRVLWAPSRRLQNLAKMLFTFDATYLWLKK